MHRSSLPQIVFPVRALGAIALLCAVLPAVALAQASTKDVLTEDERQKLAQQVAERLDQDKPPALSLIHI